MLRFALVGCLMASAFLLVASAQADPPNVADPTWQTSGGVYAIARTNDRVFLGGAFTQVRPRTGGGGSSQPRVRLAAFDVPTGDLIPSWSPEADNIAWGMTASPDGTRIYAGGDFTSVDGVSHTHLVALDATTGAVIQSWDPSTNGRVYAIAALGNTVYIGGSFSSVNGSNRQHVAALDRATGRVMDGWNPGANGTVRSLALAPDGSRIYLGGKFSSVGGSSHSSLAAVDTGTGNTLSWKPSVPAEVLSVAATQDRVVAGTAGTGGNCVGYDPQTGSQKWLVHADGNIQAVGVAGHLAYCGGHGALAANQARKKIFAADVTTGALVAWNPGLNSVVGVRTILGYGAQIAVGGDFTIVGTESREGFAQFTDPSITPTGVALPYSTGFDAGLGSWGGVTNGSVDPLALDSKAPSARFEVANGKAFAYQPLSTPRTTVCLKSSISVVDHGATDLVVLQLIAASGSPVASAFVSASGEVRGRSDVSGNTLVTGSQLPFGWSTVELCATTGASGSVSVYLNGTLTGQMTTNTGSSKIARLQLGDATAQKSFTMFADDVAADVGPI
jgi:predicted small secreted protein